MFLIVCLRIRMPRLSEGLILHVRQHEIVWKYKIWTYSGTEEAELWQSRQSRSAFTSLGMKADLKCETLDILQLMQKGSVEAELPMFGNEGRVSVRSRSSDLWQSRLSESAEAKLQIFGSPDRDEMRKRNFTYLEVLAEQVRKAELQIFASQGRAEAREQNFTYWAVRAERKCRSGTSHFLAVNAERKCGRGTRSLAVKAERKCGSGTSGLWQSRQSRSVEAEFQIFSRQDRAEVQTSTLTVQSSWTCGSRS